MAIGCLFRGFDPSGKMRHILIVSDKRKFQGISRLKAEQQVAGMGNGESILRRLRDDPDEAKFCNRTGCQFKGTL